MPSDETVIGGETVALQLRKLEYSGQVIVWNPEQPACTRSDKPLCSQSIDTLVEGIFALSIKVNPFFPYLFVHRYL
jgi:hypothetical protein